MEFKFMGFDQESSWITSYLVILQKFIWPDNL